MTWTATISIIVPIFLGLLFRLFPGKVPPSKAHLSFAQLHQRYKSYEALALPILLLLIPGMTFLFGFCLETLYHLTVQKSEAAVFMLMPDGGFWYIVGLVFTFGMLIIPVTWLYRSMLGEEYYDYILYTNLKHGYDGLKVYKYIAGACNLLAIGLLFLITDYSIEVFEDKVVVNEFLEFEQKKYEYMQMENIHYILYDKSPDNNNLIPNPTYHISFKDGSRWNTNSFLTNETSEKSMVDYIRQRTAIPIDTFKTVSELDTASL